MEVKKAYYHLPGMFEFYEFYKVFLALYREHREYFYDWCEIASIYGSPSDCIWAGGRVEISDEEPELVLKLLQDYGISVRLTFSNSLLAENHLSDRRCNKLCEMYADSGKQTGVKDISNGIIVHSELLLDYLRNRYPQFYFVSSTTKVITEFDKFVEELNREEFSYVVADFRLNKALDKLQNLTCRQKDKVEFLINECCYIGCRDRKECYEEVSRKNLAITKGDADYRCSAPGGDEGYKFSKAMAGPAFISIEDIQNVYMPMGFSNFKIEGRGLGSAMILEFLLYYMTKPEYQLRVREEMYLDSMLDLF